MTVFRTWMWEGQKDKAGIESRFLVWLLSDLGATAGKKKQVCRGQQQVPSGP